MSTYYFEKYKRNIILLNVNFENKLRKYLLKIPYKKDETENEYNIYSLVKNINIDNHFEKVIEYKKYENVKIDDFLEISFKVSETEIIKPLINLKILYEKKIVEYDLLKLYSNKGIISNIEILLFEYNSEKKTLCNYLKTIYFFDNKFEIIKQTLDKLEIIHDNGIIHGDLKLNNILYYDTIKEITFIDLEFSVDIRNKKYIQIKDLTRIDLYLCIYDKEFFLDVNFLKIFDIYLFALSNFMLITLEENFYIVYNIKKYIENVNNNKYYVIYFIFLKLLFEYSIKYRINFNEITDEEYYRYCEFNKIIYLYDTIDDMYLTNYELYEPTIIYIDTILKDIFLKNKLSLFTTRF